MERYVTRHYTGVLINIEAVFTFLKITLVFYLLN